MHFVHYFVGKYTILVINVDIFLKCIKQYRQHILCLAFYFLGGREVEYRESLPWISTNTAVGPSIA